MGILRKTEGAQAALLNAVLAAAEEYANGGNRAEPIVRRHFTAGNADRYQWPPLSPKYAKWKEGGTTQTVGGVGFLNAQQRGQLAAFMAGLTGVTGAARKAARAREVSRLRGGRPASRPTGGQALPMLVLSGRLRDAVAGGRATVRAVSASRIVIRWSGLPDYARFHEEGTPKMARRSPVEPNDEDRRAIVMAARRYLSASIGTPGQDVPGLEAGRARVL